MLRLGRSNFLFGLLQEGFLTGLELEVNLNFKLMIVIYLMLDRIFTLLLAELLLMVCVERI